MPLYGNNEILMDTICQHDKEDRGDPVEVEFKRPPKYVLHCYYSDNSASSVFPRILHADQKELIEALVEFVGGMYQTLDFVEIEDE